MKPPGSWTTLYGMGVIGVLILLVACFNFMNLATARATMRAREISLRKCMGARRDQLVVQFLGESVLMALLALAVALALVEVLLALLRQLSWAGHWNPLHRGLAADAGHLRRGHPGGPAQRLLSRPGSVGFPTRRHVAHQRLGPGRLRPAARRAGGSAVCGLDRSGIGALVVFQQIEFARNIDLGFSRDNIVFTGTPAA